MCVSLIPYPLINDFNTSCRELKKCHETENFSPKWTLRRIQYCIINNHQLNLKYTLNSVEMDSANFVGDASDIIICCIPLESEDSPPSDNGAAGLDIIKYC